ncbi:hypothetical protein [uncultured Methanobrevibacter sp.]|nr:hypothetical protein [uncultured Methanobrevibacter sp.]
MMKRKILITVYFPVRIVSRFLIHQSSVDLDEVDDLKELNSLNDLFMIH